MAHDQIYASVAENIISTWVESSSWNFRSFVFEKQIRGYSVRMVREIG